MSHGVYRYSLNPAPGESLQPASSEAFEIRLLGNAGWPELIFGTSKVTAIPQLFPGKPPTPLLRLIKDRRILIPSSCKQD
eukprot:gene25192-10831_t